MSARQNNNIYGLQRSAALEKRWKGFLSARGLVYDEF